ncbi:MAG: GMC family oxidoreductase [Acidimicrobiia bacterium]|nr:GMC family oxidoreductase [Acidimicrobiia bacterium]
MSRHLDYDVLVVGSGFGGSVTALRLTEKGYRVGVLEAGRRWSSDSFPATNWNLRKFIWMPSLGLRGIQRLDLLKDVMVLSGAGVGGGSLVYGNTLYEPLAGFYDDPQWASLTDWRRELAPFYATATRMLGATTMPHPTPADEVLDVVAMRMGVAATRRPTQVGVFFGEPGVEVPDPYFGGEGPDRSGCRECGGCMVGCRYDAKNTLDRNYLYLAEAKGAEIHPEREVVDVVPLSADPGRSAYEVVTERPGAWVRRARRSFRAEHVVFSAGVLGTMRLLHGLRMAGRLPLLSDRLGHMVRTNSEAIVSATARSTHVDYSTGVAITSSMYPEEHTHIEPVRYPKGSNSMGLLATVAVDGGGSLPRPLRFLLTALRHPAVFARSLSVRHWSERTIILLVMQSLDNSLRIVPKESQPHGRGVGARLTTEPGHGAENPRWIPAANEAARLTAEVIGGDAGSTVNEVLLDVPMTAHILGGACIGADPQSGVIDAYHRVFGHPGLHVADGSAVSANLGVNPSLTITAMTERAMSMWPAKGDDDLRPPLGSAYQPVGLLSGRTRPPSPA